MRRWKLFLRNSVVILSDLRRLLLEFHVFDRDDDAHRTRCH